MQHKNDTYSVYMSCYKQHNSYYYHICQLLHSLCISHNVNNNVQLYQTVIAILTLQQNFTFILLLKY